VGAGATAAAPGEVMESRPDCDSGAPMTCCAVCVQGGVDSEVLVVAWPRKLSLETGRPSSTGRGGDVRPPGGAVVGGRQTCNLTRRGAV
jgi:hypothetical protein